MPVYVHMYMYMYTCMHTCACVHVYILYMTFACVRVCVFEQDYVHARSLCRVVDLHEREEDERGTVEQPLHTTRREIVLVEQEQANEIDDEGQDDQVTNETLLYLNTSSTL